MPRERRKSKTRRITPEVPQARSGFEPLDLSRFSAFNQSLHVPKSSYRDTSLICIIPSRDEWLHRRFIESINGLQWPMNGRRVLLYVTGAEVGKAYSEQIAAVLAHPELSKWKYVLTLEDDTLPPPHAVIRLCESIEAGPFDGVGALYYTKSDDLPMPMCYGNAEEYRRTGVLEFRPVDVVEAVKQGAIVPCNGIANGCSLYRLSMFKELGEPWFVTTPQSTQDLQFCGRATAAGYRFATDCGVICGHASWDTGKVY